MRGLAVILLGLLLFGAPVKAQTLTADISSHIIGITTGFVGADLVLFGSADIPGDIVVIVRGPSTEFVVRRKEQHFGLWLNGSSVTFREAPSFYAAAASRPIEEIAGPDVRARYNIGVDNIRMQPSIPATNAYYGDFRSAFLADQESNGLYRRSISTVNFLGERLFRADMTFPSNVPTGNYTVEVILFSEGQVVGAQTTPLIVSRIGFSNGVYVVAHRHAALYGAGALAFAVAAGWAAGAAFRKV